MKNLRILIIVGAVIAVAAIAVMIYMVSQRRSNEISNVDGRQATKEHGFYTFENKDLGYRFTMSDEFGLAQEQPQGYYTLYSLPIDEDHQKYTNVFGILAVPKAKAAEYKQRCAKNEDIAPQLCIDFANTGYSNNLFYFDVRGRDDTYFTTTAKQADIDKLEAMMAEVKQYIKFFDVPALPQTLTYEDIQQGYSFKYPAELATGDSESRPLRFPESFGIDVDPSFTPGFDKVIPVRYCSLSGRCQPTTTNYAVQVGALEMSTADLLKTDIGQQMRRDNYGGANVYLYDEGAEGEGIHWTFVLVEKGLFIVFAHRYIDENTLISYKTAKDFTPYAEQKRNVMNMINSLDLQQPFNIQ